MSYGQSMKHWKNHKKDRFFQQCAPVVTSTGGSKKDYDIITESGTWIVTAYSIPDAINMFQNDVNEPIIAVFPSRGGQA